MGGFTSLVGGYVPQVGDEVVISGRVTEFFNLTQLSSARAVQVVRGGVGLDAEVGAFDAAPPDDLATADRYWERREGMRSRVPCSTTATATGSSWAVSGSRGRPATGPPVGPGPNLRHRHQRAGRGVYFSFGEYQIQGASSYRSPRGRRAT